MKASIAGLKGASLVAIFSIALFVGCDDYYPICIDYDGRIFVKERPYRVFDSESKRKTKFGVTFAGKGNDENNAILTANWTLWPDYWVQGKWTALAGKKQNPRFSFGTVGTKSSTGLTLGLRWQISEDLTIMQTFAWDDQGTIPGSARSFDNLEVDEGRSTGEFWIQSRTSGMEWSTSLNFKPYGASEWTEIHDTGPQAIGTWGFQYSGGYVGMEKGSQANLNNIRIWPGSLPEDATEDEELEYYFAKAIHYTFEGMYLANECPSGWYSSFGFFARQASEEIDEARTQIQVRYSFKKNPGKKIDKLLAKTQSILAKATKKSEKKGAKSWSVYKVAGKARKTLFKAFTQLRMDPPPAGN